MRRGRLSSPLYAEESAQRVRMRPTAHFECRLFLLRHQPSNVERAELVVAEDVALPPSASCMPKTLQRSFPGRGLRILTIPQK